MSAKNTRPINVSIWKQIIVVLYSQKLNLINLNYKLPTILVTWFSMYSLDIFLKKYWVVQIHIRSQLPHLLFYIQVLK